MIGRVTDEDAKGIVDYINFGKVRGLTAGWFIKDGGDIPKTPKIQTTGRSFRDRQG